MIYVQTFIGCKPSPYESVLQARELFELFVNSGKQIRREQIISISTCEFIWRDCPCYTITLVYDEARQEQA